MISSTSSCTRYGLVADELLFLPNVTSMPPPTAKRPPLWLAIYICTLGSRMHTCSTKRTLGCRISQADGRGRASVAGGACLATHLRPWLGLFAVLLTSGLFVPIPQPIGPQSDGAEKPVVKQVLGERAAIGKRPKPARASISATGLGQSHLACATVARQALAGIWPRH